MGTNYIDIHHWQRDNERIQLKMIGSSDRVTAQTRAYVTEAIMDDLVYQIRQFLSGKAAEAFWTNKDKEDQGTPCVSLQCLRKDKWGHIVIEVYMELDDGEENRHHHGCFYIETEMGLLTKFCDRFPDLKRKVVMLH